MKKLSLTATLLATALGVGCNSHHISSRAPANRQTSPPTFSSFDPPGATNALAPHTMRFVNADIEQVLAVYQELSGRSLIRSPMVPANIKITFENTTTMTRAEALQALDNVFAAQNIVMAYLGMRYVKVIPAAQAPQEPGPVVEMPWEELPDSSSYLTYIARLKHLAPEQAVAIAQPFAKLPNSIVAAKGSDVLVLRDYSANVRRMMQVLELADKPGTNFLSLPRKK